MPENPAQAASDHSSERTMNLSRRSCLFPVGTLLLTLALLEQASGQEPEPKPLGESQRTALADIDARYADLCAVNKAIWEFAEVGLEERRSSALLVEKLRSAGFEVKTGVANMPTAFVASFG
jgi:aminobenzoyl-glutamate utilization protein B